MSRIVTRFVREISEILDFRVTNRPGRHLSGMHESTNVLSGPVRTVAPAHPTRRRDRCGDAVFRAPLRARRRSRRPAPADAIRPTRIEIRGATVRVVWGWQGWHQRSWTRGQVGFVCSSRTIDDEGVPSRVILVVDRMRDEGAVAAVLCCDAFDEDAYRSLTRHLRNVEAIGDAERASHDPLARLGSQPMPGADSLR